ncbi:MAG: type II secretion system protein [Negativicutes bacterium]|nr:type II secretion system protein [Negativicutes bacterium]
MLMRIRKSLKNLKSQKGFTLVELLAVIAIIGILVAIAVPKFSNATTSANTAKVAADLRTIDSAIAMYAATYSGVYPTTYNPNVTNFLNYTPTPPTSGNANVAAAGSPTNTTSAVALTGATYGIAVVNGTTRGTITAGTITTNNTAEYFH